MRALIAGFGSIGQRHARNLRQLRPHAQVILMRQRGSTAAAPADVHVVHDLHAALATRPDVAIIATPSHLHWASLEGMLREGIPCYVEKPVVADAAQADALEHLLRELPSQPPTMAGCNLRLLPSLARLRTLLDDDAVGKVVRASLEVGQWLPDWRPGRDYRTSYSAHADQGGGVIFDLIHEIDQARWLFGEPDTVHAIGGRFSSLELDAEDTACMLLGYRGGPVVTVSLDYVSRWPVRRYTVVGETGNLIWDLQAGALELVRSGSRQPVDCRREDFDISQTYVAALRAFLDCVEHGDASSQDIGDGLRTLRLALRVKQAAGL